MSYRNPGIIKTPVAGEGMTEAIAGAVGQIGGAVLARKAAIEEENRRIQERKDRADAAELDRYNKSLEKSLEDTKEFEKANSESKTDFSNLWGQSTETEFRLLKESEADNLTLDEKKAYSKAIYEEKLKRSQILQTIGDIGATRTAAIDWEGDINFTSDKGEAFYEWSKEMKGAGSKPWKLTPGENNTSILSNGSSSYTFDNKEIATFKFGVNTPEIFKASDKMITDFNADLKKRAFDSDTATPQVLGEIRVAASQAGKTVQAEIKALSGVDKTAFKAALEKKLGLSDEDITKYESMVYSGDASKVSEAFNAINLKVQQRVDLDMASQTGLTLNENNEFVKEEKPIDLSSGFNGAAAFTLEQQLKDLRVKTKSVTSKEGVREVLGISDNAIDVPDSKWDLKTVLNDNILTISKVDPSQARENADGQTVGYETVELGTYDLTRKSDVMSYLRNQLKYSAGTAKALSDLADAITKAQKTQ